MRELTSGVRTTPYSLARAVEGQKKAQDDATARMGSDSVAVFGTADPDFIGFTTPAFSTYKPVTVQSGAGLYGTVAILPEQQHTTLEDRYYKSGTPFVMDRAGTANVSFNVLRSGRPPAGYYGGNKLMVQRREKHYFKPDPGDGSFCYIWQVVEVRAEPKDYALQPDEQLDGSFFPGSLHWGVAPAYGWTFPATGSGQMYYSPDPYDPVSGWSGAVLTVPNNPAAKPTIASISPSSYTLGDPPAYITITGTNFTDCGYVMIGPFLPGIVNAVAPDPVEETTTAPDQQFRDVLIVGAYPYRLVDNDTTLHITTQGATPNLEAGTWDIIIVGADGQIARSERAFTVLEAP